MSNSPPKNHWSWRSQAFRGLVYQVLAVVLIVLCVGYLAHNTQTNMRERGIQSGFEGFGVFLRSGLQARLRPVQDDERTLRGPFLSRPQ